MMDSNPPLLHHYGALLHHPSSLPSLESNQRCGGLVMEECQLPLIDLNGLKSHDVRERIECAMAISKASSEWGFFQVVNHGISPELLKNMRREQMKLFQSPFELKASCRLLNDSYRWGILKLLDPTSSRGPKLSTFLSPRSQKKLAMDRNQLPQSASCCQDDPSRCMEVMEEFAATMSKLARMLAGVLAENLGHRKEVIEDTCDESACFLRLNHYPAYPVSPEIHGLVPHTDSGFLTILCQDQVGGLQLMKDFKWVAVKPNEEALIVNIGDLFQAWSNDVYKSVEHRVMTNKMKRFSIAYFLCPSYDSLIGSCREPSMYKKFTFGEYRKQIREDVSKIGHKVGLSRFLL
ncbi:hypothetical protein FNV43_RR26498 [Rhamnella rubrinervis]|uniref:Fe2OG dioxygenase domain-containing protein n=1 Tax=Rhamnella rubrinervis TaxID=2594499 RepID=A0A8K0DIN4_9ROSA|nr:hypothetical protein FNV43_RR26498 [Rhamnella rubrinervis]